MLQNPFETFENVSEMGVTTENNVVYVSCSDPIIIGQFVGLENFDFRMVQFLKSKIRHLFMTSEIRLY